MKKEIKIIIVIGSPGSGKTSVLKHLALNHKGIAYYSIGELYRKHKAEGTSLGNKISRFIDVGAFVPVETSIKVLNYVIKKTYQKIVFIDGYPRNEVQLKAIEEYFSKKRNLKLIKVFVFATSKKVAAKRIRNRKREDDNSFRIKERINNYYIEIKPVIDYFKKKHHLCVIDAEKSVDEVFQNLLSEINELL